MRKFHLVPLDEINGYEVRPGFYEIYGATAIPGGVSFTVHSSNATSCELLLFNPKEDEPFAIIPFPSHYKIGNVFSMIVFKLDIEDFEYAYRLDGPYEPEKGIIFDKNKCLLDPYARAVTGQNVWGALNDCGHYKARVVRDDFDWGSMKQPHLRMDELIIYELHVRGFTNDKSSGVKHPGTFEGLREKIPYLKELGINAVELMPIFEFDETKDRRDVNGTTVLDYWGYNPVSFFAPNTGYSAKLEHNHEGNELKHLIKELNDNGIEVILDVVFNHTAEGNELGPYISFKGFDNNIYYILTPDGKYYNFSGCGNTLNCNHPVVRQMIIECLRYWVTAYRVDGFRFDLATILGRNEDGSPMSQPPLLQSLAFDPVLSKTKLIAEAWDAGGLYQVGTFPAWNRWAEWNGKYRDDMRSFLKGDEGYAMAAANRIIGSPDIYDPEHRGCEASVNFLTCHDGFTLYDLYSYNYKHNEANGWGNTDGESNNRSWNCGWEGETDDPEILKLRYRLIRNAAATLLCSRGTPMFFAGDEFCNTSFGNNNPYCQDNIISWLDWKLLEKNKGMFDFFKNMIAFRKNHEVVRRETPECTLRLPNVSMHGIKPWEADFSSSSRVIGVMFAGNVGRHDEIVYIGINAYWEDMLMELPDLGNRYKWHLVVNTYDEIGYIASKKIYLERDNKIMVSPRSVVIFEAVER